MNRHVRNHVRHMFYNDYNRRHPRKKSSSCFNNFKGNNEPMSKIDMAAGTIAIIGLFILCHFFKTLGIVLAVITFIFGLWPLTILFAIITFI